MTGTELAAILTAVAGLITGVVAAFKAVGSQKLNSVQTVVDAYMKIVDDLQEELARMQARLAHLEKENAELRKRVRELERGHDAPKSS